MIHILMFDLQASVYETNSNVKSLNHEQVNISID